MDNSTVALLELVIAKLWNIRDDDDPSIEVLAEMAADGLLHLLDYHVGIPPYLMAVIDPEAV